MSCYEARLLIQRIDLSDANTYEIEVENDKGSVLGTVLVHIRGKYHLYISLLQKDAFKL